MRRLIRQPALPSMVFDARKGETFVIALRTNVNSLRVINAIAGTLYIFVVKQNNIGGKTLAWGSSIRNATGVDPRPLAVTVQSFIADTGGILKANLPGTWSAL